MIWPDIEPPRLKSKGRQDFLRAAFVSNIAHHLIDDGRFLSLYVATRRDFGRIRV